jgi:hypothetical protein
MMFARRTVTAAIAAVALLIASLSPALAGAPDTSLVYRFVDGSAVEGSYATLDRHSDGVTFRLRTSDLPPNSVVTLWAVVFNAPQNCSHGTGGFRCGEGDLLGLGGDGSAQDSVFNAAGRVVGPSGRATYAGSLKVGQMPGALWGAGLTDPAGADIHFVLRTHGKPIPGLISEQLKSFGAGCTDAPPGTGTPGPNECSDPQFAVFETN